jgi:hypothetical protein
LDMSCVPCPSSESRATVGSAWSPTPASREVTVSLGVSTRAVPAIRFPGPSTAFPKVPSRCSGACPSPPLSRQAAHPPSDFGPSSEAPSGAALRPSGGVPPVVFRAPPLRFLAPPASSNRANRRSARFHPGAFPPRPFADPRGLCPHSTLRPCFMPLPLLGFLPFRASPCRPTLPGSSPGDPLPVFSPALP